MVPSRDAGAGVSAPPSARREPLAAAAHRLAAAAAAGPGVLLVLAPDARTADAFGAALRFFAPGELDVVGVAEREMLPYDVVSQPRELVSERLRALARLPRLAHGVVIATADLALERLPSRDWLAGAAFECAVGERLDVGGFRAALVAAGYAAVGEVRAPGEFAVRGGLLDVYPSGAEAPVRIDLFDDRIETLRHFDPDSQLSSGRIERVALLPAWEFPFDEAAIRRFRQRWRARFAGDPMASEIYRGVSDARLPAGIENWLGLFFDATDTLDDYLPEATRRLELPGYGAALESAWAEVEARYEAARHDLARPLLEPVEAFVAPAEIGPRLARRPALALPEGGHAPLPDLELEAHRDEPLARFATFVAGGTAVLFAAASPGRRESARELFARHGLAPVAIESWPQFLAERPCLGLAVAELEDGFLLEGGAVAVVPDGAVFGARAAGRRPGRRSVRDPATIIRDLTDLAIGAPVVHQDHGVGRFRGLVTREVDGNAVEFVLLEYAEGDRLYVPVASLDRLSRYLGADPEHAPLTRLGSGQWERARRKAARKAHDAAAELLELYARRAARPGHAYRLDEAAWERFTRAFPFEETADQKRAIDEVVADLTAGRAMDRLVCGDVGFGKTEVALRAAFVAVEAGRQVAVLVPTTLLAEQHYRNFLDRFADWPVRVELLSRFRSAAQQGRIRAELADGRIDIVIGTHALLGREVRFQSLGLVIVDEEHRFGVRHKERLKALRAEVDVLTLTATPIPRTLSMTLAGIRDLSLIATPPEHRLPIKTEVTRWQDARIRDAVLRELRRGGQVFVVHNEVRGIGELAARIAALVPEASVRVGHGQMPERELEALMADFYRRRFDVLVATTIIESGIDIPTANTILINNAHRFGLAQLHQLRGRVGRSRHQAYAYLLAPPADLLGREAKARLDAVAGMEELGAGFFLATQDLEIRGAGALLGEEQSGQMAEVGLDLYNRMLERAVRALKTGADTDPAAELDPGCEVDLGAAALLPADYIPDVHLRLVLYKRIASAAQAGELEALRTEIVDRFGTPPEAARHLFDVARIKQAAQRVGITRVLAGAGGVRVEFGADPAIDTAALIGMVQERPREYRLQADKRLDYRTPLPEFAQRLAAVERLLGRIALPRAA